jgi:hypothetical protein
VGRCFTHTAHLVQHDVVATLGQLPRGFAPGETTTDNVNGLRR